ncbi:MAG: hypothetical protein Q4C06_02620 [Bacillota bacterium]|nr:hypothetical protein [Bacillota bacterium]
MLTMIRFASEAMIDKDSIYEAARYCMAEYQKGNAVLAVVSAMEGQEAELRKKAMELNGKPSLREMDLLLSAGAQMTAALLAIALEEMEMPAVSLQAYQTGIYTTEEYGNGEIAHVDPMRIKEEIKQGKIVLAVGDQGITEDGEIVTLKNGGDAAALALAEALQADRCIWIEEMDNRAVA